MKQLFNLSLLLLALILPATASAYDFEVDGIYYSTNGNGDRLYCPVPYHADSDTIVKLNGQPHGIEIEEGAIINVGLSDNHKENPAYESVKNRCEEILDQFKGGVYQFHSATGHHLNAFYSESVTSPDDSTFVVSLPTSGTLINIIGTENVLKVKCLKVSGNLNGTDILAIRKMINLCVLDMADAHIVDGGASYYQNYTTSKDAIGEYFFNNLTNLSSIKLPSDLKTIKEYAFNEMTKLEEINIPDSVTSIGEKSFYNCIGLSIATIGKSVTSIGSTAFYGCNALTELHWNAISCLTNGSMPTNNLTIITIGDAVQILPDSFAKDSKITVISLSNSVTEIRYNAFLNCVGLTEITLPDNVTEIGSSAFEGCTGLSEVSIPNKVEIINSAVFKGCINIEHVTIGNHVKEINSQAFYACEKLDRIEIPSSVNEIYGEAFNGCTSLTEVLIHDGSGSISLIRYDSGHAPFYQCPIERLHLGKTIRTNSPWYGEHATTFSGMSTIKYLTIGNLVRLISSNSFNYCSGLIEVNIGSNVKTIGSNAFSDCSKLTSIIIPNSVTDINASAFSRCYELNNLVIGNSVSTIGDYAFSSCTELTSIDIPGSVTSIGNSTFAGCTALTEIYSYNTTPPAIQETTFDGATEQNAILHVPSGCRTIYWLNPYWENFGSIVEIDPVIATTIELEPTMAEIVQGNTLQLIATVRPDNTFNKKVTWISSNTSVATVDSTGLVKAVATGSAIITATTNDGSNLTASCSVTVTQPESSYITFADSNVKAICIQNWDTNGDGELSEGEAAAVTSLNNIFTNNSTIASFDELEYFTGLSSINDEDFSGCQGLTSVHIPNPIISIGDYAFNNCFQLKNVTIPNSVVTIGKSAFYQCCKLTSLTIPDSVTSIGQLAFAYCNGLSSLTIPASVTSIGRFAFTSSGSNLTSIRVSSDNQFYDSREDCNAIIETSTNTLLTGCMSTIIPNTVTAIGESAFANYYLLNSIHIPESVVSIGEQAFTCCSGLTSINIPNSVTTIGWYAFSSCTSLTSIEIPNSVTYIGGGAFKDCAGLNDVYSFISGPTTITMGDNVFYRSTNNYSGRALYVPAGTGATYQADGKWYPYFGNIVEMESTQDSIITFADANVKAICIANWDTDHDGEFSMEEAAAVTTLGSVFRQNTSITSFDELKYFTGLAAIELDAFNGCSGLTSIKIPNSVNHIGPWAFDGCKGLTSIEIPNSVTVIDYYAFGECSGLSNIDFPNSVVTIGEEAFSGCRGLTNLFIPNSVTSIGILAFASCSGMTSLTVASDNPVYDSRDNSNSIIETATNTLITGCQNTVIPNTVTSIGDGAFSGCSELTNIEIPNSVTSIGNSSFWNCRGLTSIGIPNSVTSIGNSSFWGCRMLASIEIPNSVTSIGDHAFQNCWGLTDVTIPNSVTYIGAGIFTRCYGLTRIIVESDNSVYDSRDNCNGIINTVTDSLISGCVNTVIPNSVTSIGDCAFQGCRLTEIDIPNSVTSIGISAFAGCNGLASLVILNSITSIGNNAFSGCTELTDVYSFIIDPSGVSMGDNVFYLYSNEYSSRTLHVPFGTASAYQANGNWYPYFGNIVEMEPNEQDSIIVFGDANVKAICIQNWDTNGDGELSQAEAAAVTSLNGVFKNNQTITSFDELQYFTGLNSIESHEFYNCKVLTSISIPNNVTVIGSYAFCSCSILDNITIGNSVTTICLRAFYNCRALTSITIPNSVVLIEYEAFRDCSNLASITIPNSVTQIEQCVFSYCSNLSRITVDINNMNYDSRSNCNAIIETSNNTLLYGCKNTAIPSSVLAIGNYAFEGCKNLTSVSIPNSVKRIGFASFYHCSSLKNVIIPNSVTIIDNEAFDGCTSLTSITIPNSVTTIGEKAFECCSSLTSISISNSVNAIGDNVFHQCISLMNINVANGNTKYDSRNGCNAIIETESNTLIAGCKNTTIPNSVTSIGKGAFENCSSLASITIPNSVKAIDDNAFSGCSELNDLTIPNSVTSIGNRAFAYCNSSKNVYCHILDPSVVTTGTDVFYLYQSDYSGRTLHVPIGTRNSYQADANWYPYFGQIVEMISATSINLDKTSVVITEGETMQLNATVLPEDAESKTVSWSSSNPLVATIESNGMVTAVAHGTATITVTTTDGSNLSAECEVAVIQDLSNYDNYLSMNDTTVMRGDTIVIPVRMTNDTSIISFQTDIFLPEGLEILQEDGEFIIDPSSRMTRTHSIMSNDVSSGAIRVLCYSSNYKPFIGNSGDDLFYITVKVADDAEGDYIIQLKNTLLTNTDFVDLAAPDVAANVNVKAYLLGDANNSGTVTITDVVVTAQYVLELNPQPFVFEAADANVDGNITVADVSRIAWMVLNPAQNVLLRAPALWNNGDRMSAEDITLAVGETRRVCIMLDNEMDYSAFQLDLNLPEGLTASNFQLTDRAGSHSFDVNSLLNGNIRALCYSPALTVINGHEGALLTFEVTAAGDPNGDILVDGIELVTTGCQSVKLDAFTIGVNNASSVSESIAGKAIAKVEYFNLAGQRMEQPSTGVTLIVTTYTDGSQITSKVIK